MKKFVYVLVILFLVLSNLPIQTWALNYDNISIPDPILVFAGNKTYVHDTLTEEDGYVLAGTTRFNSGSTVFLQKIDKSGNVIWNAYVGGSTDYVSSYVRPKVVKVNDNYYVIGSTQDSDIEGYNGGTCGDYPCSDILVAKVDTSGNVLWKKAYGTDNEDIGYSAIVDGNYLIVVGYIDKDTIEKKYGSAYVMKIDENGNVIWSKDYLSYDKAEYFYDITKVGDTYIAVGMAYKSYKDITIFALDGSGNVLWHTYTNQSNWDEAYAVTPVDDTHFLIGGVGVGFENFHDGLCGKYPCTDGYVAMYDINGNKSWGLSIGGSNEDRIYDVGIYDGNIYVVGYTKSSDGDFQGLYTPHNCGKYPCSEGFVAMLSQDGTLKEGWVYDSSTREGSFYSIECLTDGYIVGGYTSENADDPDTGLIMTFVNETEEIPAVPEITEYPTTANSPEVTISGTTDTNATHVEVVVNDTDTYNANVTNQSFEVTITLQEGENTVKARACNSIGCSDFSPEITITYTIPQEKPDIPTLDPVPSTVYTPYITVSGKTDNLATKVEVFVGGEKYDATVTNQQFSVDVSLYQGENKISARACNDVGCSDFTQEVIVNYVTEVPAPVIAKPSTTTLFNTDIASIDINVSVEGTLKIYVNNEEKLSKNVTPGTTTVNVPVSFGENYIKAKICVDSTICSEYSNILVITVKERITIEMWVGSALYKKNGQEHLMDAAPFIMPPGRTVVPARFAAEGMGFKVEWNPETRESIITGKDVNGVDTTVIIYMPYNPDKKFQVGDRVVYPGSSEVVVIKNDIRSVIDLTNYKGENMGIPVIHADRIYVPLRFVSEIFGSQVLWDGNERKVTIIFER